MSGTPFSRGARMAYAKKRGYWDDIGRMPFGTHEFEPLGRVPLDYLGWVRDNTNTAPYPGLTKFIEDHNKEINTAMRLTGQW